MSNRLSTHKLEGIARLGRGAATAVTVILLIGAGVAPWDRMALGSPETSQRTVATRGALTDEEQSNIALFRTASRSVVHITTLELATNLFSFSVTPVPRGTGTGFVWDEKGHVVTNYHVIQGGSAARVTLADQSTWKAALVGAFPDRDLAVLRIDAPREKLKPILLGESSNLQVGQKVYAIGNPFGLDQTLTTGIVSALNREIESANQRTIRGVIQTDAAINPGNSGGQLLDSAARLVGVNAAIYSPSGGSAGIGFAIPVDEVRRIVPRLIRDGKFLRPSLGVRGAADGVRQALGLPPGIVIVGVERGSPAEQAGLRAFKRGSDGVVIAGDELIAVGGAPIRSFDDLLSVLESHQPGDSVSVAFLRSGKRHESLVRLGAPE